MIIDIIAGARPNFMKIAPIIGEINRVDSAKKALSYRLVHTGQHYDKKMSADFFTQLGIPEPDINLEVGSGSQAEQTAKIMIKYEALLFEKPCDLCLVVGDVTSTMACAITAKKLKISVAHVEAGIRSGDMTMPEEVNRMVTDSITDYFFTTSKGASSNLVNIGVEKHRIFFVGNTMIDTLLKYVNNLNQPEVWKKQGLSPKSYILLTMHRPSNVDQADQLKEMLLEIIRNANGFPVVFPVHPRTSKVLGQISIKERNFIATDPMSYLDFIYLLKYAKAVITDSGGITEEATVLGVPCMSLRDSTERPETVEIGTNELVGTNPQNIKPAMNKIFSNSWKKGQIPEKWDGQTAKRIVEILRTLQ